MEVGLFAFVLNSFMNALHPFLFVYIVSFKEWWMEVRMAEMGKAYKEL